MNIAILLRRGDLGACVFLPKLSVLMRIEGPVIKLFRLIMGSGDAFDVVASFFAVFVILLLVFPVYEFARGFAAKLLGDDTPEKSGRLTLNPLAHLDPMGAILMLFLPIGWTKPIDINYSHCHKVKPRTAIALTAAAGPAANILTAYIVLIVFKIVHFTVSAENPALAYILYALYYIILICLYLAVLNLFPIPPFAGSRILFAYIPPRIAVAIISKQQIISLVFMLLLFTTDLLTTLIGGISQFILTALDFLSGYVDLILG